MGLLRFLQSSGQASGRVFISGTGRAGTTYLVQVLTELGLDTGFKESVASNYSALAKAGLEWNVFDRDGPHIIKSPFLCDYVDDVVAAGIDIRHVIIPVRDFASAARSRVRVQFETTGTVDGPTVVGGLWDTEKSSDQVAILEHKFGKLVESLTRHDIPMTFVSFPRTATDEEYLFSKLKPIFPTIGRRAFGAAFRKVSRPEFVHDFSSDKATPIHCRS